MLKSNTSRPKAESQQLQRIRDGCVGIEPLEARLEPWMINTCGQPQLHPWIEEHGSPLNILSDVPFRRHIQSLREVAATREVAFEVYFARKANKCLSFVDAASDTNCGIDIASEVELNQVLSRGCDPKKIICTAAIKSESLINTCIRSGVVIAIDNHDEFLRTQAIHRQTSHQARVAIRVSGFRHDGEKLFSRFGFDIDAVLPMIKQYWPASDERACRLVGIHFHLDGYCWRQRVSALSQSIQVAGELSALGHHIQFIDMGGGIPMSYLQHEAQWETFWKEHRKALQGQRPPLTYQNHGLGLVVANGSIVGEPKSYPYFQSPTQSDWLCRVLDAECSERRIAEAIRDRGLQLRCEPGRSILDGCGMTVARVEFRKQHRGGDWLIGLSMNRTQCRTSSDDFLVDPILIPRRDAPNEPRIDGYLVGAYCTESELLSLRKFCCPQGVRVGDLVVFPNTAGYLMHFLESRSHQFPLAKNVFVGKDDITNVTIDDIDLEAPRSQRGERVRKCS